MQGITRITAMLNVSSVWVLGTRKLWLNKLLIRISIKGPIALGAIVIPSSLEMNQTGFHGLRFVDDAVKMMWSKVISMKMGNGSERVR